ncbi:hypothetical protein PENNAL_c0198G08178 [Penicillium nalgiovense]|uniref:Uncharacterized protein n=1 Tax=Penicillium nalgiovense TaxID=60175 RepID=A0A1V6WSD2_PENNA|nr:hypothetical protein PENNAL_c0198G08178 [Penicillium nalgiovense]
MTSKSNEPPSARGPEDVERRGRTRRETVMAQEATVINDDGSDDDDYQPSNEGDRTVLPENVGVTPMIDAFDYVSPNYPLRPARAICVLDRAQQLARLRPYKNFQKVLMQRVVSIFMGAKVSRCLGVESWFPGSKYVFPGASGLLGTPVPFLGTFIRLLEGGSVVSTYMRPL